MEFLSKLFCAFKNFTRFYQFSLNVGGRGRRRSLISLVSVKLLPFIYFLKISKCKIKKRYENANCNGKSALHIMLSYTEGWDPKTIIKFYKSL